ncbi:2-hydroxychromene-2-carboxylate isomerase [Sphingomonas soli]|uniref:2-hydroxychromene-2-carboxylate isomerase n=1 Tax=Sphingomonas soli TaxID=266127 RepID=UPI000830D280|nr:2-hydroxychromene-2-carboxylate isomerase [Sphingomonas soli]
MTATPIEFWFDLTSPYAYFAGREIDALAARHGRTVDWKPFLLGAVFKVTGSTPLTAQPLKGDYARHDWARLARLAGVPFVLREDFPLRTHLAARMVLAAAAGHGSATAGAYSKRLLEALFEEGANIADANLAAALGAPFGIDPETLIAAGSAAEWREALRLRCDEAVARAICGSPWIIVDGEPFWGADRLAMVERWLSGGGW